MKVNIVTEGNWIKKFWSDKIIEYNKTEIEYTLSLTPTNDTDINFYICYNTYLPFSKSNALDIGYVTHIHENNPKSHSKDIGYDFDKFKELDGWIHQSLRSYDQFLVMGYPPKRNFNLTSPVETHKFKPTISIGIFQNGEVAGKGLYFMEAFIDSPVNLENFKFIFCGRGWDLVTTKLKEKNIRYEVYTYTPEQYHNVEHKVLYEKINYLLVPSLWEGGPVAPLEAMSCGVPIISSDVGFMPEFGPEYQFQAGDLGKLKRIFKTIEDNHLRRRNKVIPHTYKDYNEKLLKIFKQIKELK
jgi:glycosyltransferase involved in cell wall biosynthesis